MGGVASSSELGFGRYESLFISEMVEKPLFRKVSNLTVGTVGCCIDESSALVVGGSSVSQHS